MANMNPDPFDEMMRRVIEDKEPQYLDRHGVTVAVVVPFEAYEKLTTAYSVLRNQLDSERESLRLAMDEGMRAW